MARMFAGWASRALAGSAAAIGWARDVAIESAKGYIDDKVDEARGAIHYLGALRADCASRALRRGGQGVVRRPGDLHAGGGAAAQAPGASPPRACGWARLDQRREEPSTTSTPAPWATPRVTISGSPISAARSVRTSTATTTRRRTSGSRPDDSELLARVQAENPGVPIDIVAHSQGGLVARMAISDEGEPSDPRLAQVSSLVTLGTPHRGAPAATAATMLDHTSLGEAVLVVGHALLPDQVDPTGTSVKQMAEHSQFIATLERTSVPAGVKFTSIAAREDFAVPAGQTVVAGANNVTVSVPGLRNDHKNLPGSPEAQREIALALAGFTPTCQSFGDAMADAAVSGAIYTQETLVAAAAYGGSRLLDHELDKPKYKTTVPRRYDLDPPR